VAQFLDCTVRVLEVLAEHGERRVMVVGKPFDAQELIQRKREVRVLRGRRELRRLGARISVRLAICATSIARLRSSCRGHNRCSTQPLSVPADSFESGLPHYTVGKD
jgi:hypothetical protein